MSPITIVLTENYSDWEVAVLAGVGRAFYGADIRFASPDGGALSSAAGLSIVGLAPFKTPFEGVVAVCGSPVFESSEMPNIAPQLREAWAHGCIVAGICGGTVALAEAGLLDEADHTSNGPDYLPANAPGYNGAARYIDQPGAIRCGRIITAPAPAPASFASEVLKAAGLDEDSAHGIRDMLADEHAAWFKQSHRADD